MKRKVCYGFLLFIVTMTVLVWVDYYNYRKVMDEVQIVHYITGSGSGYSTVYLTAVVPAGTYQEGRTAEAVRRYAIYRDGRIPDVIQIVLYDSMDKLRDGESYFKVTFRREN